MSCKMMLRFREDKICRLESQAIGSITADQFLQEDNKALSDEIQLLRAKLIKILKLHDLLRRISGSYTIF